MTTEMRSLSLNDIEIENFKGDPDSVVITFRVPQAEPVKFYWSNKVAAAHVLRVLASKLENS